MTCVHGRTPFKSMYLWIGERHNEMDAVEISGITPIPFTHILKYTPVTSTSIKI